MRLIESHDSRKFTFGTGGGSMEWRGMAWGSDDPAEVYDYVRLNTELYLSGFTRRNIDCAPLAGGVWEVSVEYGTGEFPSNEDRGSSAPGRDVTGPASGDEPLESSFAFQIEAPKFKITQSLETISSTGRNASTPKDYKGAIAPDKDGKVQGAEVPPTPSSTWTRTVSGLVVTMNFYRQLVNRAGRTNQFTWYGFLPRELLYMGCDGQFKAGEGWTLTHKFGVELTRNDIVICDGLTVDQKRGFEYLWIDYHEIEDGGGTVTVPKAAYVEKVFEDTDFTFLGLGG